MSLDFSQEKYYHLCEAISKSNKISLTFEKYLENPEKYDQFVILRHDIDSRPINALSLSKIEKEHGLKSTHYFRLSTFEKEIVKEISSLGDEIGYHYEVLSRANGKHNLASKLFAADLDKFRSTVPIKTISMHGAPFSRWNNLEFAKKINFSDYNLLGEAYLSINYSNIYYYTDTGRSWCSKSNLRDNVEDKKTKKAVSSTDQLIKLLLEEKGNFIINTHPQRWSSTKLAWFSEYAKQNIKNTGKFFLGLFRND